MLLADAYTSFRQSITSLFFLDQRTQEHIGSPQLFIVNEAILLRAFRAFENLAEESFIHYSFGRPTLSGTQVVSFLAPKDDAHAYELIKSSQPFLEWNKPDVVIGRAETYLENGGPIKAAYAAKQSLITDIRRIRNHIAHNSRTSLDEFKKTVQSNLHTMPLSIPQPGELLQGTIKRNSQKHRMLRFFLDELDDIGHLIAN